jgi:hypothetical protein
MLHVATDTADRRHHVLSDFGTRQRPPQLGQQSEPSSGGDFTQPRAASATRQLVALQTPREIADPPFSPGGRCPRLGKARGAPKRAASAPAGSRRPGPSVFYGDVGIKYIRWRTTIAGWVSLLLTYIPSQCGLQFLLGHGDEGRRACATHCIMCIWRRTSRRAANQQPLEPFQSHGHARKAL